MPKHKKPYTTLFQYFMRWKNCGQYTLITTASLCFYANAFADDVSYAQAEQHILQSSYTTQASTALQHASEANQKAVQYLGMPRVDLNVRAYKFHTETDIPLQGIKQNLEQTISQSVNDRISSIGGDLGLSQDQTSQINTGVNQTIHNGVSTIPDTADVSFSDQTIRSTVSVIVPMYTGGSITSTKNLSHLQAQRSQLNNQQQQDIQRFEVIQRYFNVQLQQALLKAAQNNVKAMQQHVENAYKLEKQGFISKGQRMQFEVARNQALIAQQTVETERQNSLFSFHNLMRNERDLHLTTPLFINSTPNHALANYMQSYRQQSSLVRKMQMDTDIAEQNIKLQSAAKKPSIYAFGEYTLDDKQNWIVGVVARYNLFSGINHNQKIQAAEWEHYAAQLMAERTKQEIENMLFKAYANMLDAQKKHVLLQQNLQAAQENLRIQNLSFKEDMGTVAQIIDAENAYSLTQAQIATNAYQYILALATLLQSHGSIAQFKDYTNQVNTTFIQ
ncbi:MAG: TolC family protein [Acinetobacter sp.]